MDGLPKSFKVISFLFLTFIFISCGNRKTSFQTQGAPGENQEGVLVQCKTESEVLGLVEEMDGKYRVLSSKNKFFEIYGVSEEIIKEKLKGAKTKKNRTIQFVAQNVKASVVVTNEEYVGKKEPTYITENDYEDFPHLKQIRHHLMKNSELGEGVVIAIVDTGVSYNHPHLSNNIFTNESDPHGGLADGIDNDGNGKIDDYAGWDFVSDDPYPVDDHGHGTHVAGLAAGTLSGVAPKASLLPIKVLNKNGGGDLGSVTAGIIYALNQGADFVNLSLGAAGDILESELSLLFSALEVAKSKDSLLVAAAGNGGFDAVGDCNDVLPTYPANIESEHIISIASVDSNDNLTSYSNYGPKTVDIAAPGGNGGAQGLRSTAIFREGIDTFPGYTYMSGTSMATPVTSGVLALIKSENLGASILEVKKTLFSSGRDVFSLDGNLVHSKVVDALNASLSF